MIKKKQVAGTSVTINSSTTMLYINETRIIPTEIHKSKTGVDQTS